MLKKVLIYGATGASFLSTLPIPQGAKAAVAIPFLIMPAAFAYKEGLRKYQKELNKLFGIR